MTTVTYDGVLTPGRPHKQLVTGGKRFVGRNNAGRITVRHKGGGHKRLFRDVDFMFDKKGVPARVEAIQYDPNRSGFIALVCYSDGERRYVLAPQTMKIGDTFVVSPTADIRTGNRTALDRIPVGTFVYNIELKPGNGARIARSAGVYAEVIANDEGYAQVRMPSGEVRKIPSACYASIGAVSNEEYQNMVIGKAGRSRWMGIRPTVRGSAMNPVDHPYGGGEGRQGRGRKRAVSLWGKPTGKGQKTRTPKKYSNVFIVSRRPVGKKKKGV